MKLIPRLYVGYILSFLEFFLSGQMYHVLVGYEEDGISFWEDRYKNLPFYIQTGHGPELGMSASVPLLGNEAVLHPSHFLLSIFSSALLSGNAKVFLSAWGSSCAPCTVLSQVLVLILLLPS